MVEMSPCGHRIACMVCAQKVQSCPLCRATIVERLLVPELAEKEYKPSHIAKPPESVEILEYARYLGIDPVADQDLLWIAREAFWAPLSSPWTKHCDNQDRVFYYNSETQVSSWLLPWMHPAFHVFRETYLTITSFRETYLTITSLGLPPVELVEKLQKLRSECEQMELDVYHEIGLWTKHYDEQGHRFYFNRQEKLTSWIDPRPAACQILCLKMRLVQFLSQWNTGGFAKASKACDTASSSKEFFFNVPLHGGPTVPFAAGGTGKTLLSEAV